MSHMIHVTGVACFSVLAPYLNLPSGIHFKKTSNPLWALVIDGKSLECLLKLCTKFAGSLFQNKRLLGL